MYNKMKKTIIIFQTIISLSNGQNIYFVNNLIEKNGTFYNYMNDNLITGKLYFNYIIDDSSKSKFLVGELKDGIKNGLWTRYWNNGNKKKEGIYKDSFKVGLWVEWSKKGNKYLEILYEKDSIVHFTNCLIENCN
jgi:antitoxin component YwqK of YwqJK toxin-antitoxin module